MFGPKGPRRRTSNAPRPAPGGGGGGGALETVIVEPTSRRRPANEPARAGRGRGGGVATPAKPRLVDLAADWLSTVLALGQAAELPDAASLRARALELKGRFERDAGEQGFAAADTDDAVFAMVAFLDETILNGRGAARDAWIGRPLQLELYGRQLAGEEFFERLDRMRGDRDARIEALEVYLCCLAFGFAGRFKLAAPEKLSALIEDLRRETSAVRGGRPGELAPNARHRAERVEEEGGGTPWFLPVAYGVAAIVLAFLIVWLMARIGADNAAAAVQRLIK